MVSYTFCSKSFITSTSPPTPIIRYVFSWVNVSRWRVQRTKHFFDVLPFNIYYHRATRTSPVQSCARYWGVACIWARADMYAIIIGSLADDQIRHSPEYIDEANIQSVFKRYHLQYHVQPPPRPPRHWSRSNVHIALARKLCTTPALVIELERLSWAAQIAALPH